MLIIRFANHMITENLQVFWAELLAKVAHNDGELSSLVMESFPAQRLARFKTVIAAHAFFAELERTGGWTASLRLGWVGSGFKDD